MWREGTACESRPGKALPAATPGHPAGRRMAHVCFVAPHAWPVFSRDPDIQVVGGAEVQMSVLARLFAANGYRVSMICLDYGQASPTALGSVVVRTAFRMDSGVPVLRFVHPRLTGMWRALREADADIYYCRSASMWLGVVAAFCRLRGKRVVYAGASNKDFVPGQGGQIRYARDRWLYRRGLAAADAIVAQNEVQRADARRHYGREAVLIPSCYELPAARAAGARDRVLWVGTIHAGKRPELLLELAARLPQRRFVMVGGPNQGGEAYFEAIRARAAALRNVEFTGFLPLAQVEPWFDRARVVVNTSVYEGMPNVFLQAWARGVPTVATVDVGVPCHRVARDAEALAREVESLYGHPAAGERCRRYFERTHSSSEVLARYARLFEQLAA
jgi:glycosyltransferase involved in cell wall biosynthesis